MLMVINIKHKIWLLLNQVAFLIMISFYFTTQFFFFLLGRMTLKFAPADGSEVNEVEVFQYKGGGVGLAMFNTDEVIYADFQF